MAEVLGLGLSHYPPLCLPDADMAGILRGTLRDPSIPEKEEDPDHWPAPMRAEWADDVRAALDEFKPDAVLMWGDDQHENFREDLISPFAVLAFDDLELRPWDHAQGSSMMKGKANVWGEGASTSFRLRGRPDIAKPLVTGLIEQDIDVAYAYKPLHHGSVAHAFTNAVLYLDYHRKGYDHPTICFPLNCYGRRVVSAKGFLTRMDAKHYSPTRTTPRPRAFRGTGAKEFPVLWPVSFAEWAPGCAGRGAGRRRRRNKRRQALRAAFTSAFKPLHYLLSQAGPAVMPNEEPVKPRPFPVQSLGRA